MKIVIDIPEESYNAICTITTLAEMESVGQDTKRVIYTGIQNGTILPKGHGRLIDADAIKPKFCNSNIYTSEKGFWYYSVKDVNDIPTIIEADKEN